MIPPYPLRWPDGVDRQQRPKQSKFSTTLRGAIDGLRHQLALMGARDVVITSNARTDDHGKILSRQGYIADTGVAVYFTVRGEQRIIPCDTYDRIEDNLHAIELTVEALRSIERWGGKQIFTASLQGFAALPAGGTTGNAWWDVLGIDRAATRDDITAAYRGLVKTNHPDVGGSPESFHEINEAYQAALRQVEAGR